MKLREIVIEEAIIPELKGDRRDDVLAELVDAVVASGRVDASLRDAFLAALVKRENRGSTGFGHGVAVPHVKHPALEGMIVAVGISAEGVDFNALDKQPVYSIIMLLSPEDRPEDHLDAMEAIFKNLSRETFRRFLRQASSAGEVLTLLDEADAGATAR